MDPEIDLMKPKDFGQLVGDTFKVYKKNFAFFVKVMVIFFVPAIIVITISSALFMNKFVYLFQNIEAVEQPREMLRWLLELYGWMFVFVISMSFFTTLASAAAVKAAGDKLEGKNSSVRDVLVFTLRKFFPIIITSVMGGVVIVVGTMFCIIPGLILSVYLLFITQAIMLENKAYFSGISRSFEMVSNNFWMLVLIVLVFSFIYSFAAGIVQTPVYIIPYINMFKDIFAHQGEMDPSAFANFYSGFTPYYVIGIVIQNVLLLFYTPILNTAMTIKYLNIRNLKEGTALLQKLDKGTTA